jgi:hypothetical protein
VADDIVTSGRQSPDPPGRNRWLAIGAAAVAVIVVTVFLAGRPHAGPHAPPRSPSPSLSPGQVALPVARGYPGAITARVGVRNVISMASIGDDVWAITRSGQDSLWLLADLAQTQVLRIAVNTGQPLGRVRIGGSCGQPCSQIYDAAAAIWVPSGNEIVRIDPARLPG